MFVSITLGMIFHLCLCLRTSHLWMMIKWCVMSSDVSGHIRDKLWPMPKHGSIILYVHRNQKARSDGQLRTATSTLTQLLIYAICGCHWERGCSSQLLAWFFTRFTVYIPAICGCHWEWGCSSRLGLIFHLFRCLRFSHLWMSLRTRT